MLLRSITTKDVTMETLCFKGNYIKRFARVKEFCNDKVEFVLDVFLREFCNIWFEEEYVIQSGREWYQRSSDKLDYRAGHYSRTIITGRGVIELSRKELRVRSLHLTLIIIHDIIFPWLVRCG